MSIVRSEDRAEATRDYRAGVLICGREEWTAPRGFRQMVPRRRRPALGLLAKLAH